MYIQKKVGYFLLKQAMFFTDLTILITIFIFFKTRIIIELLS